MTHYALPELRYDYGALEPHIQGRLLELHHDKHHRAYVEGANRAIERLHEARRTGEFASLPLLQRQLAFNVSGHVLHSIFWQNLTPNGGGAPEGELEERITRDFGSVELMQRQLTAVAATVMGSGWAALVWEPITRRLGTTQIHDHQSEVTQASVPLLVIDAWEHAYYLQYQAEKARFFDAIWHVIDWEDVSHRLELASRLELGLDDTALGPQPSPPLAH